MAEVRLPDWLKEPRGELCPAGKGGTHGFLDKTLMNISAFMRATLSSGAADRPGALQSLSPKARIAGFLFLILAGSLTGSAFMLIGALVITAVAMSLSNVSAASLAKRVAPPLFFTSVIAIPVFFEFITPGAPVFGVSIGGLSLSVTREGAETGLFLILRVGVMVALSSLLLLTTRQADFFSGLKELKVPHLFVTALYMTFRYIFVLLKTAEDAVLARKSRTIATVKLSEAQGWAGSRMALILKRSISYAEEVNMAMISRGFDGRLRTLRAPGMEGRDYIWIFLTLFFLFLSFGV
ncbi:MAG: cobalt ECF transporter T component CbiQ [Deltaproteobacteria bacterium GWC2_56_8]|nr:MAG: cobalt ECF transporter T component CbiQ [Deltaproteobacteria bacterium GWC2_56_8]